MGYELPYIHVVRDVPIHIRRGFRLFYHSGCGHCEGLREREEQVNFTLFCVYRSAQCNASRDHSATIVNVTVARQ